METTKLDSWKKFELKKIVAEVLPPDDKNEYSFARRMIFSAWDHFTIKEIQSALEMYFPEISANVKEIVRKKKVNY